MVTWTIQYSFMEDKCLRNPWVIAAILATLLCPISNHRTPRCNNLLNLWFKIVLTYNSPTLIYPAESLIIRPRCNLTTVKPCVNTKLRNKISGTKLLCTMYTSIKLTCLRTIEEKYTNKWQSKTLLISNSRKSKNCAKKKG